MRSQLLQVLTQLTQPGAVAPRFILNTLATALAYLTLHTHVIWPTLVEDITSNLSGSVDQALCLLHTLKYMANDCDNQSIVIEESIRKGFYKYLDSASRVLVF